MCYCVNDFWVILLDIQGPSIMLYFHDQVYTYIV